MVPSNRHWLPAYCDPSAFLPEVQEIAMVFRERPFLFRDFVGKAMRFLDSQEARSMGFVHDRARTLPCKWKCSDESVFGVDLCLYAYTGQYPFDKGRIGGRFNESAVAAAVHHAPINVDFGGAHVGYETSPAGGRFGRIPRPLHGHSMSTDCGALMGLVQPFQNLYDEACKSILVFCPPGTRGIVSIPNEFIQPSWSTHRIKLLVDLEALTVGVVPYDAELGYTHKVVGRSLFRLHPRFMETMSKHGLGTQPVPIGRELTAEYFNIFDTAAEIGSDGVPKERVLPYMKHILSGRDAPAALKIAVISTNLEHNSLTDCVRAEPYRPYSFACFTGVFLDVYDDDLQAYVNLFQPLGLNIKPAGRTRDIELAPAEIRAIFDKLEPAEPRLPIDQVMGHQRPTRPLEDFVFTPGRYEDV